MTVEKVSVKNEQEAEALALVILEFILADQVLLDRFLAMSGVTPRLSACSASHLHKFARLII